MQTSSIVGETFRRLRLANNEEEARAVVAALISERTSGQSCTPLPAVTSRVAEQQQHRTSSLAAAVSGRLLDDAAHEMAQPSWEATMEDVAAPQHYPQNLEMLSLYSTVGTFAQSAAAIDACLRLVESDGQERIPTKHRKSRLPGSSRESMYPAGTQPHVCDEGDRRFPAARNASGQPAPTEQFPFVPDAALGLVFGMMWWLPEKWACIAPSEWTRAGRIAHRFEYLLRKFAPLHLLGVEEEGERTGEPSPPSLSPAVQKERVLHAAIQDIVIALAKRWNRSIHFRRYNDFHKTASCGYASSNDTTKKKKTENGGGTAQPTSASIMERPSVEAVPTLVHKAICSPDAALDSATREWLQLAPHWSQLPCDEWIQATSKMLLVRLLTEQSRLRVRVEGGTLSSTLGSECSAIPWFDHCIAILNTPGEDHASSLLRVALLQQAPQRDAFLHDTRTTPTLTSGGVSSSSSARRPANDSGAALSEVAQRKRALLSTTSRVAGAAELGDDSREDAQMMWQRAVPQDMPAMGRRKDILVVPSLEELAACSPLLHHYMHPTLTSDELSRVWNDRSANGDLLSSSSSSSMPHNDTFLWAYMHWMASGSEEERSSGVSDIHRYFAAVHPAWSTLRRPSVRARFAQEVLRSCKAHLGFSPACRILEAVNLVASQLLLVMWWNLSRREATRWLLALVQVGNAKEEVKDDDALLVDVLVAIADQCGASLSRAMLHDDTNAASFVGAVDGEEDCWHGGVPVWLAVFVSDPLNECMR